MKKRSQFIDALGVPATDLRGRPKCALCGIRITLENWGSSLTRPGDNRKDVNHFCDLCFLKPEAFCPRRPLR